MRRRCLLLFQVKFQAEFINNDVVTVQLIHIYVNNAHGTFLNTKSPHWHPPTGTLSPSVCLAVPEADVSKACLSHRVHSAPFETPTLSPLFSTPAFAEHSPPRTVNKGKKVTLTLHASKRTYGWKLSPVLTVSQGKKNMSTLAIHPKTLKDL